MTTYLRFLSVPVLALLLTAAPAHAAYIVANDGGPSQGVSLSAGDFEFGFHADGTPGINVSGLGNGGTTHDPSTINFNGSWIDLGQSPNASRTIYFVNPTNPSQVVDAFQFTTSTNGSVGSISGSFTSYLDQGTFLPLPSGVSANDIYPANGQPFNLGLPFLGGPITPAAIPEPTTLAVFGLLGVGGLGYIRRRLKVAPVA